MKTLCATMLTLWTVIAAAEEPGAGQGVLLLRNGQTIEGQITREDDHYRVAFPDGEIRLRVTAVECYCRTLQEGYQRKRAALAMDSARDHLELAQWCQRHGLYRSAAEELSAAAAIEPKDPMLGVLRRRQELALEPPPQPLAPAAKDHIPSAEDLDRMTRGMPPGAVETFSQVVQPLLMNHCMASGCHGPQTENSLRLMRTPVSQPAGRRLTQRNLHAVLQFIDYNNAQASRLLSAIKGPHATVKAAIFTDRQAGHYKQIADWVNQVTGHAGAVEIPPSVLFGQDRPSAADVAGTPGQPRPLSSAAKRGRPLPRPGHEGKPGPVRTAAAVEPDDSTPDVDAGVPPAKTPRSLPAGTHLGPKRGAPQGAAPADPFDAEVFNRQYAPAADESQKASK